MAGASTFVAVLGMAASGLVPQAAQAAPSGGGGTFQLENFAVAPVPGTSDEFYLNVTVAQNSADGSDFTGSSTTETHPFPTDLYFYVADSTGKPVSSLLDAAFVSSNPADGITYSKNDHLSVTGTAQYEVTIPPTDYTSSDELLIYPYGTPGYNNTKDAFRMGNPSDSSFADDVVSGTANFTIPVNDLPEAPFAGLLPGVLVLGAAFLAWHRRRSAVRA